MSGLCLAGKLDEQKRPTGLVWAGRQPKRRWRSIDVYACLAWHWVQRFEQRLAALALALALS